MSGSERGIECWQEVRAALEKTIAQLYGGISSKYGLSNVATDRAIGLALLQEGVNVMTKNVPSDDEDIAALFYHTRLLVDGFINERTESEGDND